jgi:hypothetical protein
MMLRRTVAAMCLAPLLALASCDNNPTSTSGDGVVTGMLYLPADAAAAVLRFSSDTPIDSIQVGPPPGSPDALFVTRGKDGHFLVYSTTQIPRTVRLFVYLSASGEDGLTAEVRSVALESGALRDAEGRIVLHVTR